MPRRPARLLVLLFSLAAGLLRAAPFPATPQDFDLSGLPAAAPDSDPGLHGVVRIHDTELSQHLVHLWEDAFLKLHPLVRYSEYTVPAWFTGLCADTADLAVTGRGAYLTELKSVESARGSPPLGIMFATGGFNLRKGNTPGVVIFVHRDNPLAGLTLDQLDGVLGAERTGGWVGTRWSAAAARGPEKNLRTWGQLGLTGEWANQPIQIYGIDATLSGWSGMIQQVVFKGGDKWNPVIHEIVRGGTEVPADAQIVASVAHDRYAIGFSFMKVVRQNPGVKAVGLAREAGGPFVLPTGQTTFARTYPLANAVYIYLNQTPGRPISPRLKEFLAFVLSRDGQQAVVDDGMYTPLNPDAAAAELKKLNASSERDGARPAGALAPAADGLESTASAPAGRAPPLPDYQPARQISGLIRTWGSPQLGDVLRRWEKGFQHYHPGAVFADRLRGSATAIAGLSENVAELALMGRQIDTFEYYGIYRRSLLLPVEIEVATGSVATPFKSFAGAVMVHRSNPLSRLTLAQLDGIFGAQREGGWQGMIWERSAARGPEKNLRIWGQLGLTGEWANRPIHVYGPPGLAPGGESFFQRRVMGGADTWVEGLREFADRRQMMAALDRDPAGIAYSGMGYLTAQTKALALAERPGGPYLIPTAETVAQRTYPLARPVYVYFAPDTAGGEIAARLKEREFLRYVLSRQGQDDVRNAGDYLPLTADLVNAQLKKLN